MKKNIVQDLRNELLKKYTEEELHKYGMRDVAGFEGQYAITSCGRVWSYKQNKFMASTDNGHGYRHIVLTYNKQPNGRYVHRLVAEAYVPNIDNKPEVSHLDETRDHNWVGNLTWATTKENSNMPLKYHRQVVAHGKPCMCIETGIVYRSAKEAGRLTGIHQSTISKCCRGECEYAGIDPVTGQRLTWRLVSC